jgi:hypothetical protein
LKHESAALAHLGERQTEVHFKSSIRCDFWRYCVRSTEAAVLLFRWDPSHRADDLRVYRFFFAIELIGSDTMLSEIGYIAWHSPVVVAFSPDQAFVYSPLVSQLPVGRDSNAAPE